MLELQDCVSNLQTLNNELQNQLSLADKSDDVAHKTGAKNMSSSPWKQVRAASLPDLKFKRYLFQPYSNIDGYSLSYCL